MGIIVHFFFFTPKPYSGTIGSRVVYKGVVSHLLFNQVKNFKGYTRDLSISSISSGPDGINER